MWGWLTKLSECDSLQAMVTRTESIIRVLEKVYKSIIRVLEKVYNSKFSTHIRHLSTHIRHLSTTMLKTVLYL